MASRMQTTGNNKQGVLLAWNTHSEKKKYIYIYIYIFAGKDQSQRFTDNLEAAACRCSLKKMFLKFCNIHEETVALQSLFNKVTTLNTCTAISGRLTFLIVGKKCWYFAKFSLREKCSNTEFFLVRIFPYLDWIRIFTP